MDFFSTAFDNVQQDESDQQADDISSRVDPSVSESVITGTTKRTYTESMYSVMPDNKTIMTESIMRNDESKDEYCQNEILKALIEAKDSSPMEYVRLKCKLSSRFHPVKVESIMAQCAKKKCINYKPQRKEAIAIAGMAKLYVREILEKAKAMQTDDKVMITPDSIRQAAQQWRKENKSMFP